MAITTEPLLRSGTNKLAFEDFMNVVKRVQPAETPLFTMARTEYELKNTEFSWTVNSWADPKGAEGPGDGWAVQDGELINSQANKRRMGNYGQAFRRAYGSGWIAERVPSLPGGTSPLAQGKADAVVLIKQDIEAGFASFDQTAVQDSGSATGSTMAGLRKMIDAANKYAAASAYAIGKPTDAHYAPTAACSTGALASVLNLSFIKTAAKALRTAVKRNKDYVLLAGLDLREAITGLVDPGTTSATAGALAATTTRSYTQAIGDSELGISIDVLRTDFGRFMVVPTDLIGNTAASTGARDTRTFDSCPKYGYLLSRDMIAQRWGVPLETAPLAPDGASHKEVLRGYCGLVVYNPIGFGFWALT